MACETSLNVEVTILLFQSGLKDMAARTAKTPSTTHQGASTGKEDRAPSSVVTTIISGSLAALSHPQFTPCQPSSVDARRNSQGYVMLIRDLALDWTPSIRLVVEWNF